MSLATDLAEYRHLCAIVRGRRLPASGRIWRRTPRRFIVQQSDGMRWGYVEPSQDALRGQALGLLCALIVTIVLWFL
jgi:hypothetical protein